MSEFNKIEIGAEQVKQMLAHGIKFDERHIECYKVRRKDERGDIWRSYAANHLSYMFDSGQWKREAYEVIPIITSDALIAALPRSIEYEHPNGNKQNIPFVLEYEEVTQSWCAGYELRGVLLLYSLQGATPLEAIYKLACALIKKDVRLIVQN